MFIAGGAKDYPRIRFLADSLEAIGHISPINANRWRGVSYYRENNHHMAEIYYRKALDYEIRTQHDLQSYTKSARRLSEILIIKGDYEEALSTAIKALNKLKDSDTDTDIDYAILHNNIGCCQLNLGREQEAYESFITARTHYENRWMSDSTSRSYQEAIVGTLITSMAYLNTNHYEQSIYWIDRTQMLLDKYVEKPDALKENFDSFQGQIYIFRAVAYQGMAKYEEAKEAYAKFATTKYSKSDQGRIYANDYLLPAHRYKEAIDNYSNLEEVLTNMDIDMTLDNIRQYMLPKYRAYAEANYHDSASIVGKKILSLLDSAIIRQKNSDMAELATIYDTNKKDAQIAQQQTTLARQQWVATLVLLGIFSIFFVIYTINRQNARRRLADANKRLEENNIQLSNLNAQLKIATAKAEESSKMKTNFIQQISHEIRTPLNILSGFTQVITTPGMEIDEETRTDINRQITENTNRITGLVNKMLELSDANSQTSIERNDDVLALQIAAQAIEDARISEAKNITVDLETGLGTEDIILHTNEKQATRILVLLLDNAQKFLFAPTHEATDTSKENRITLRLALDSDNHDEARSIRFIVEDTGIGIPSKEAEHVFEEFVQLNDYYDGTGIGLTVARSIARRLGGDVTLDTSYTGGARFITTLPIS